MKKIQYVKLVGLLTILLFLNISCKDDDTLLRGSGITEQSWSTNQTYFASAPSLLLSRPCLAGLLKTVPLHYCHWTIQQVIQGKIP